MRIALASDHAGVELKAQIRQALDSRGIAVHDFGPATEESVDYPDYAAPVARSVAAGDFDRGVLICGSGIGMSIAANKVAGIRAARVNDADDARLAREHNDANVLTLGARMVSAELAIAAVEAFVTTPFSGGRHQRRVDKITELDAAPPVERAR